MASNGDQPTQTIAFDVSAEMSKRIVDESRQSDKLTVACYEIYDLNCSDGHKEHRLCPEFIAWRYKSSPKNLIYIRDGGISMEPFPITSKDALISFLNPPWGPRCDNQDFVYYVFAGERTIVEDDILLPPGKHIWEKLEKLFPSYTMMNMNNCEPPYDDEYCENAFHEKIPEFVWNILSS